jgi:hypothetical protein
MNDRTEHRLDKCIAAVAALVAMVMAAAAWSQGAPPPPAGIGVQPPPQQQSAPPQPAAPPQPEPPPARQENPGLINELGKLWDKLPKIKSPSETLEDIKGAGESIGSLAKPSTMVSGRAACAVAANGAPDCKTGADRLCQSQGYKEGKSIDTDAAEKCAAKAYIPGRPRQPGDCRTENFVIKALCQ